MSKELFKKLKAYGESEAYPFHMPGHKRNPDSGPMASFYQCDITEIDGFDNLHQPEGLLLEAQNKAAALYHSQETYFLVNGSTSGILSAISAISQKGKKLIAARNCHKAVYHAAFLNRLEMEYIYPEVLPEYGLANGIYVKQIEEKLKEIAAKEHCPIHAISEFIAGIIITSPTYDGMISDVKGIVQMAHRYEIPVIIDQAHGAHFGFHPAYPVNAVEEGADIVIHSVHKTLPAPTQTALLHRNGTLTDSKILQKYLQIYQSSSPSYLLMAGIDSCMDIVDKEGRKRLDELLTMRADFIRKTKSLQKIHIYPSMAECGEYQKTGWKSGQAEPGRLVLSVKGSNLTGQEFYDILREEYQLQMEMCGADYVVAILSMMDRKEGFDRLAEALCQIDKNLQKKSLHRPNKTEAKQQIRMQIPYPEIVFSIAKAFLAPDKEVPLLQAKGQIAANFVNLYPPGIPFLVPGEKLDDKIIAFIEMYLENGYTLQGVGKSITGETVLRVII